MKIDGPRLLADYAPPAYLVDTVELDIKLAAQRTRVHARLALRPNPGAAAPGEPLVLDGEHLELAGFTLNGRALGRDDYTVSDTELTVHSPPAQPLGWKSTP